MHVCVCACIGHVLVVCESVRASLVIKFLIYDHVNVPRYPLPVFHFRNYLTKIIF